MKLIAKLFGLVFGFPTIMGGADTSFATGATETVKRWAARLWVELPREIYFGEAILLTARMGRFPDSVTMAVIRSSWWRL